MAGEMNTTYGQGRVTTATRGTGGLPSLLSADVIKKLLARRRSDRSSYDDSRDRARPAVRTAATQPAAAMDDGSNMSFVSSVGGPNVVPGLVRTYAGDPRAVYGGWVPKGAHQPGATNFAQTAQPDAGGDADFEGYVKRQAASGMKTDGGAPEQDGGGADPSEKWYGMPEFVRRQLLEKRLYGAQEG
jgi:hypothetical protein